MLQNTTNSDAIVAQNEGAVRVLETNHNKANQDSSKPLRDAELPGNAQIDWMSIQDQEKDELREMLNISELEANRRMIEAFEQDQGLLGHFYRYTASTGSSIVAELAASTAIFSVALLSQRQWWVKTPDQGPDDDGTDLNLYMLNSAPSASGKSSQIKKVTKMFEKIDTKRMLPLKDIIADEEVTSSGAALRDRLRLFPSMGLLIDEFHLFIGSATGSRANPNKVDVIRLLLKMSNNDPVADRRNLVNAESETVEIPWSSISAFGCATTDGIKGISKRADLMNDGFMNRFFYVPHVLSYKNAYSFSEEDKRNMFGMVENLIAQRFGPNWKQDGKSSRVFGRGNMHGYVEVEGGELMRSTNNEMKQVKVHKPKFKDILIDDTISDRLCALVRNLRDFNMGNQLETTPSQPQFNGGGRDGVKLLKLCGICAISKWAQNGYRSEPLISEYEYEFAKKMLSVSVAGLRNMYATHSGRLTSQIARDESDAINKCLSIIEQTGTSGISRSLLIRKIRLKATRLDELIDTLMQSDRISLKESIVPTGAPKKRTYIALN